MPKVLTVAWRDFKHTALTKTFIIAGLILPLLMFGAIFLIGALFRPNFVPLTGTLVIVDPTGKVADAAKIELGSERIAARIRDIMQDFGDEKKQQDPAAAANIMGEASAALPRIDLSIKSVGEIDEAAIKQLKDAVRRGEYVALAVAPPDLLATPDPNAKAPSQPELALYVPGGFKPNHTRLLAGALRDAVVRARVDAAGQDYQQIESLVRRPEIQPRRLADDGTEATESVEAKMFIPFAFMMLLWMTTFTSGNHLLTSTIEEKSNKVMEVLLSAVSPMQLMAGKIIGMAGVSFLMMAIYAGLGIAGLTAAAMMDIISPLTIVYLFLYFIMAYFMVAAMMAGVGSAVSDLREAQSLITPVMLVMMIPFILWLPISENPNGPIATVTSFIPPLIPFVMIIRVTGANEQVALWQVVLSLVWGYAAMIGMVWMCAKIFRVGVLMYGKPPSPVELVKWLRYR